MPHVPHAGGVSQLAIIPVSDPFDSVRCDEAIDAPSDSRESI